MSEPVDVEALLPPGTVLAGKYEVVRLLGRGGMGVVVEARHLRMNRSVALKILLPALRAQPDTVARFEREARAAAQIKDEHVTRVLDVDTLPDGSPFMVMELLRGKDLGDHLAARGKLPFREAVGYLLEACAGMVDAHRAGIVHRDLKPNNLFLDEQGGRRVLKILDFGISKVTDETNASMTATSTVFGTPLYMSPEQVRSTKNVDARADIWSLGIVLYELLAGEPPFTGPSGPAIIAAIIADRAVPIAERCPDLPPALADAVMRALEKSPDARYPDVQSFAAAIAPFAAEGHAAFAPSALGPASTIAPASAATNMPVAAATRPPSPARPFAAIGAGMVAAFAVGGVLLFSALRHPTKHAAPTAEPAAVPAPTTMPSPVVLPEGTVPSPIVSATPTVSAAPSAPAATGVASVASPKATAVPAKTSTPAPDKPTAKPATPAAPATPKPSPPADDPKYL